MKKKNSPVRSRCVNAITAFATIDSFNDTLVNVHFTIDTLKSGPVATTLIASGSIDTFATILARNRRTFIDFRLTKSSLIADTTLAHHNRIQCQTESVHTLCHLTEWNVAQGTFQTGPTYAREIITSCRICSQKHFIEKKSTKRSRKLTESIIASRSIPTWNIFARNLTRNFTL